MKKTKALKLIADQLETIESLKGLNSSTAIFLEWKEKTKVILKSVFSLDSTHYKKFDKQTFYPLDLLQALSDKPKGYTSAEIRTAFIKGLDNSRILLTSAMKEVEIWDDDNQEKVINEIEIIKNICERFHYVARQIRERHDKRPTIEVDDEYDVQDLLHALLKIDFDDVRAEEWTPSYAGSASRMDFLLKQEQIVVEVKKTRKGLQAKEVGEQLITDIARYTAHPNCKTLICFVYDPEGKVANPVGIENDLNREADDLCVITIITPK